MTPKQHSWDIPDAMVCAEFQTEAHLHVLSQLDSIIWEKLQDGAGDSSLPLVMVVSVQLPQTQVGVCRW